MEKLTPERARRLAEIAERAREFYKTLPHCMGYPDCDGDLVGIDHSEKCPLFSKVDLGYMQFAVAFATSEISAAVQAEREQACKDVCDFCSDTQNYGPATFGDVWLHDVLSDPEDYRICSAASIHERGSRNELREG